MRQAEWKPVIAMTLCIYGRVCCSCSCSWVRPNALLLSSRPRHCHIRHSAYQTFRVSQYCTMLLHWHCSDCGPKRICDGRFLCRRAMIDDCVYHIYIYVCAVRFSTGVTDTLCACACVSEKMNSIVPSHLSCSLQWRAKLLTEIVVHGFETKSADCNGGRGPKSHLAHIIRW